MRVPSTFEEQNKATKEVKRSKIQILVGKKRNHFATAGALIASISMIAFSGSEKPTSQALVEVSHQEIPLLQMQQGFDLGWDYNTRELSLDMQVDD